MAESERQRLERIAELPAPRTLDMDTADVTNDLEVIRVKVKPKRSKKGKSSKRDSDSDVVSIAELDSPVSQESGYRSVPEDLSPKSKTDHRLSVTSVTEEQQENIEQTLGKELHNNVKDNRDSEIKPNLVLTQSDTDKPLNQTVSSEITNQKACNKESANEVSSTVPSGSKMEESNLQQNVVFSVTMDSDIKWNSKMQSSQKNKENLQTEKATEIISIYDGLLDNGSSKDEKSDMGKITPETSNTVKSTALSKSVSTDSASSGVATESFSNIVHKDSFKQSTQTEIVPSPSPSFEILSKGSSSNSLKSLEDTSTPSGSSVSTTSSSKVKGSVEDFEVR